MKKFFYEFLYSDLDKVYEKIDNAAIALCALKGKINNMSEILEKEYKNKYKTSFENGTYISTKSRKKPDNEQ